MINPLLFYNRVPYYTIENDTRKYFNKVTITALIELELNISYV